MMSVRLRLAATLVRWFLKERKQAPQPVSRLSMRCWWTDVDINVHMNNSRYLTLMDVGRYHFLLVSGLWQVVRDEGWAPVLVGAEIQFRKSLRPGQRFVLETSLLEVGNKSSKLRQRFLVGDTVVAEATVTALFLKGGKSQPVAPMMTRFPHLLQSLAVEPSASVQEPDARSAERVSR